MRTPTKTVTLPNERHALWLRLALLSQPRPGQAHTSRFFPQERDTRSARSPNRGIDTKCHAAASKGLVEGP